MIARRRLKTKSKIDWNALAIPKTRPVDAAAVKASGRHFNEARREVRRLAFHHANGRCRKCRKLLYLDGCSEFELAHAHEIVFRSDGGDPLDIRNVVILCLDCHLIGAHKQGDESKWFRIHIMNPLAGSLGKLKFLPWKKQCA